MYSPRFVPIVDGMRTRRNLWLIPPGDDGTVRRALRRRARHNLYAGFGAFVISVAAITYPLMNESTAVSGDDVLAEFRAAKATTAAPASDGVGAAGKKDGSKEKSERSVSQGSSGSASPSRSRTTAAASPKAESQAVGAGGGGQKTAAAARHRSEVQKDNRPAEGVYTWSVEGFEQAPGVRRDLPKEAHRVVTHESDAGRWIEHMVFSEQKEMWFDLTSGDSGVVTNSSRNKVTIGPVTQDKTVVFNPPIMVSNWPFKVGETWSGEWDGKVYGTYEAKTFEHGFIEIEGERVEVYASEVFMEMKGDIEGTVLTRSWVAPKYSMVVKQYMETDVKSGPGDYYSEWMGTVQSLTPQT